MSGGKPSGDRCFTVPVDYRTLDNGLKVVLSPDPAAPIVTVAVYYNIGFRSEPRGRTGFAHLFEHMMFQGSDNLGKMEFIKLVEGMGGVLNGSTRFDFTNYFEVVPAHKLETILWAEADRMRSLAITGDNLLNQQKVVINEVKVAVHNTPYGGFPWLDMPQQAHRNWHNAHNFYGDIEDVAAASLEEVQAFFDAYYTPNNAALVLTGDLEPQTAFSLVKKYFGDIDRGPEPVFPDTSEPPQKEEKRARKDDPLASRPALAFSYHMPERNTPDYYALGLLNQILIQGEDSLLHRALVKREGLTGSIGGGINLLGNMFNANGPILFTASLFFDDLSLQDRILSVVEEVIGTVRHEPVGEAVLRRARVKFRSALYDTLGGFYGFGRADLLAAFALFDDDPDRINLIEQKFNTVTPDIILQTAREHLRPSNRTVLTVVPKSEGS